MHESCLYTTAGIEEGEHMRRFIVSTTVALGCAFTVAIHAQDTTMKSKTKVSGGDAKVVTYTGCVQTGTETESYILEKAVP